VKLKSKRVELAPHAMIGEINIEDKKGKWKRIEEDVLMEQSWGRSLKRNERTKKVEINDKDSNDSGEDVWVKMEEMHFNVSIIQSTLNNCGLQSVRLQLLVHLSPCNIG